MEYRQEISVENSEYSVEKFNIGVLVTRLAALQEVDPDIDAIFEA